MGLFDKLFGRKPQPAAPVSSPDHCVLAILKLSDDAFGTSDERAAIHALSDQLEHAIASSNAGAFDGDEFGGGQCTLFMYGPDAERLFSSIESILRVSPVCQGATVIKRFGPPGDDTVRSVEVRL
jgi:hypothetical protein